MKTFSSLLAVAFLSAAAPASAALIYQSQNFSNVGSGVGVALNWNKFDLSLGTLTAITLEATGVLSGSYTVSNPDPDDVATLLINTTGRIRLTLQGPGAPSVINGTLLNPVSTSPTSNSGQTIAESSEQTFTLLSGAGVNESSFNSNQFSNAAYFSAIGGGTFTSLLSRSLNAGVGGGEGATFNLGSVLASGTVNLTYEYTPAATVPEPGTWAVAGLLILVAGCIRWRKRAPTA
jgi:hypothetical protein